MQPAIPEKDISVYLYVAFYNDDIQKHKSFIAVTKAMLFDEVAIAIESLGDHAIIFTTVLSLDEIKNKLNSNKVPHLLVDIGAAYDLESIYGFVPSSQIEIIKNITEKRFSKDKNSLNRILQKALDEENFELAAPVRDLNKNNGKESK